MTDIFFLEVFNEIKILYDKSKIWFGLRDILKALNYTNYKKALKKIKIRPEFKMKYIDIDKNHEGAPRGAPRENIHPSKIFINESGLYELLSISTKPLAKIFMDKFFIDIMPKIRANGEYKMDEKNNKLREIMNNKLEENKELLNNQRNVIYPTGNALYIIKKKLNNKTYYKIGYTKNLNKRLKTYNTGNVNKILFNYYILVYDKEIDKCIRKIMKNDEFIKNKEYYKTSFNQIIKFIIECDEKLNKICCGYCLKCYNFNNIKLHKCKYI
jgi:prophage antirepressor-like protein/predicted GIY-YIG superfamily endonuclease